jgi:hypothetical protein
MTDNRNPAGLLGRTWRSFLETSEVAVAIHYDAPWRRANSLLKRAPFDPVPIGAVAGA